jgi:uncharacterized protein (DUF427 family)
MAQAVWNGQVIADSDDVTVVDGYTYFPTSSVDERYLDPSGRRSTCRWKGVATYFDVTVGDRRKRAAAWTYPIPSPAAAPLVEDRVAFWKGVRILDDDGRPTGLLARLVDRIR